MKKNTFQFIGLFTICILMSTNFSSCKKDEAQAKTPYDLLTSHKWRFYRTGDTMDDVNISWSVVYDNCEKDNWLNFFTNGTLIHDEGPTKCSPNDPQNVWGTKNWQLQANNTMIRSDGTGVDLKILSLTENSLTLIELDGPGRHDCYDLIPY